MADTVVDAFSTTQITLAGNDTLAVTPTGSIVTDVDAVVWDLDDPAVTPPGIVIVNEGLISSTDNRAIDTTGSSNGAQGIHLTNYGSITAANDDGFRINDGLTGGVVVIDNYGTIDSGGGQALDFNNVEEAESVTIINREGGLIRSTDADAIRPGASATVNNYGHVHSDSEDGDGIDFQNDDGGGVNNYATGIIEGAKHGVTGDMAVTVFNAAGGMIIGNNGSAVNIDNDGEEENTVHVTNYGIMEGRSAETADSDGDAIDTDGLLVLDNYGSIKGLGHEGYHDGEPNVSEGIATGGGVISNHEGAVIYGYGRAIQADNSENGPAFAKTIITNAGLIQGDGNGPEGVDPEDRAPLIPIGNEAINLVGDWDDELTNSGAIIGGVMMDDGADTLTNSGAMTALSGLAVDMGGGNDIVNLVAGGSISGLIDGGADTDVINLLGEGAGLLAEVANFEALDVQAGDWSLVDAQAYGDGVTIAAEASLTLGTGGADGDAEADVEVDGLFAVNRSDVLIFGGTISGAGMFEQRGSGRTVLDQANTYAGGTLLTGGTLEIAAAGAAGTGDVTFTDGAQTLVINDAALAPIALINSGATFGNTIAAFGAGDAIDLTGLAFGAGATADYDAGTGELTVTSLGVSYKLMLADPGATAFTAESDGAGGTRVVVKNTGVTINGTPRDDVVDVNHTPLGRPLPTEADDLIRGKRGDDRLAGLGGHDEIRGGKGDDKIKGGDGDDLIAGGPGKNRVAGNAGADAFLFDSTLGEGKGADPDSTFSFTRILDFTPGEDMILLDQSVFSALTLGILPDSEFRKGGKAKDSDDHILYRKKKGLIDYDVDGKGGADAITFARVDKGTDLSAADFLVV